MALPLFSPSTPVLGHSFGSWSPLSSGTPSGSPFHQVPSTPLLSNLEGCFSTFSSPGLPFLLARSPLGAAIVPRTPALRRSSRLGANLPFATVTPSPAHPRPFLLSNVPLTPRSVASPSTAVVPSTPLRTREGPPVSQEDLRNMLPPESPLMRKVKMCPKSYARKANKVTKNLDENYDCDRDVPVATSEQLSSSSSSCVNRSKTRTKKKSDVKRNLVAIMENPYSTSPSGTGHGCHLSTSILTVEDSDED